MDACYDEGRGGAVDIAREILTIAVDPASDLGRALEEVDAQVVLDRGGVRFRVSRVDDDPWAGYDPARLRAGLHDAAGTLTSEEGERLKEMIYRGREEGTRPLNRP